jgi:predicted NBD/HSP70 family sugar kinase
MRCYMNQYICFDIGGTDIKYGIIKENGEILFHDKMKTEAWNGGNSIIERVIDKILTIKNTYSNHVFKGVTVSSAGIIDPYKGEVLYATNAIPNYIGVKIKEKIETATGFLTEVENDVNCFALCEANLGVARDCQNFITLTIGTGVGGAIYLNNQLNHGHGYSAGEWGRMQVLDKKFESVASITGLIQLANQYIQPKEWDGLQIFNLYDQGHPQAKQAVDTFYTYLATGIMNLIYIFNPEKVVIGGGITGRGEKFVTEITSHLSQIIEPRFLKQTKIACAMYSNQSGMIGALYHFKTLHPNL